MGGVLGGDLRIWGLLGGTERGGEHPEGAEEGLGGLMGVLGGPESILGPTPPPQEHLAHGTPLCRDAHVVGCYGAAVMGMGGRGSRPPTP